MHAAEPHLVSVDPGRAKRFAFLVERDGVEAVVDDLFRYRQIESEVDFLEGYDDVLGNAERTDGVPQP